MSAKRMLLGLTLSLTLLASCTYLRQLVGLVADKPVVKILDVEVGTPAANRIDLVFVIDIMNPNNFAVDVDHLDYQVQGLGVELGRGSLIEPVVLTSQTHTQVRLPFSIDSDAARQYFKRYILNPRDLKLKLLAQLFLNTAFGKMDMQFQEERTMAKGLTGS